MTNWITYPTCEWDGQVKPDGQRFCSAECEQAFERWQRKGKQRQ